MITSKLSQSKMTVESLEWHVVVAVIVFQLSFFFFGKGESAREISSSVSSSVTKSNSFDGVESIDFLDVRNCHHTAIGIEVIGVS